MANQAKSTSPVDTQDREDGVTENAEAPTAALDETPGSSPEGEAAETEESLTDVIEGALKGDDESDGESESEDGESESSEDEDKSESEEGKDESEKSKRQETDEESDEEDDGSDLEEGQRVPYDRFKKVIDQRNETREKVETLESEVEQYRYGHEQFNAVQGFMQQNDLRQEDVVEALQIAAAFNRDPAQAMEMLKPKVDMLQRYTGEVLPDDLRERVEMGELGERDARELVRARNEAARTRQQTERERTQRDVQEREQQSQRVRNAMATAADETQREIAASDPEYDQKAPFIQKELQLLIQQESPRSAEDAMRLVRQAHQSVTDQLRRLQPKPTIRRGPSGMDGGGSSSSAAREPSSMSEAIAMAASQSKG